MRKYVILAETGGDVPKDIAEKHGMYIIPMHVVFGDVTRDDGDFPTTELFDYYKKNRKLPTTAACNIYDYNQIFDKIHEEHPESHILYLAYSSVTTSSYSSGLLAMEGRDYITAFDTKNVSAGQALVVTMVARFLEANPDAEIPEILAYAEKISAACRMGFFPGDLDYLRAGGRVSNAAYLGARILSLNPLIEIQNGYLVATNKYRGKMSRIAPQLLKNFTNDQKLSRDILFLVFSAGLAKEIMDEVYALAQSLGYQEIRWVETGCVVSTHSGPGAFGVIGLSEA